MSTTSQNSASSRISALLDDNSLLRSADQLLPEIPISICRTKKHLQMEY